MVGKQQNKTKQNNMKRSISIKGVGILLVIGSLCMYTYSYTSYVRGVEQEGFTELIYSRMRPQARSVRVFYEETLENALKHIDRIRYNLGKR